MVLESTRILAQDAQPGGTSLVKSRNGFNRMSRMVMLWAVRHCWPSGSRFALNCYRHWAQILFRQPRDAPVILLIREGVTQGDPLSMVLYGNTMVLLTEEIRGADPTLLSPLYADDT